MVVFWWARNIVCLLEIVYLNFNLRRKKFTLICGFGRPYGTNHFIQSNSLIHTLILHCTASIKLIWILIWLIVCFSIIHQPPSTTKPNLFNHKKMTCIPDYCKTSVNFLYRFLSLVKVHGIFLDQIKKKFVQMIHPYPPLHHQVRCGHKSKNNRFQNDPKVCMNMKSIYIRMSGSFLLKRRSMVSSYYFSWSFSIDTS